MTDQEVDRLTDLPYWDPGSIDDIAAEKAMYADLEQQLSRLLRRGDLSRVQEIRLNIALKNARRRQIRLDKYAERRKQAERAKHNHAGLSFFELAGAIVLSVLTFNWFTRN